LPHVKPFPLKVCWIAGIGLPSWYPSNSLKNDDYDDDDDDDDGDGLKNLYYKNQ